MLDDFAVGVDELSAVQVGGTVTTNAGETLSFWYSMNPFTCALLHNLVFKEDIITFKAFTGKVVPWIAALGYLSPTEELMIGYSLNMMTIGLNIAYTIPSGDYVRPDSLLVSKDNFMYIVAQSNIRRIAYDGYDVVSFPIENIQQGIMIGNDHLFIGSQDLIAG